MTKTLFIALDDSGQLSLNDEIMTFGGIILFNTIEKEKFITGYEEIIQKIKHKYKHISELKHYNLKKKDLKKLLKYINHYQTFSCIVFNKDIYSSILNTPKAKGRYLDYVIKILIKNIIKELIQKKIINPYNSLKIYLYVDENSLKSNGYYNLKESIYEELKYGMGNIRNNISFKNIIFGNLDLYLDYLDSKKSYLIQASDLVAGETRKNYLHNIPNSDINYLIYLPKYH